MSTSRTRNLPLRCPGNPEGYLPAEHAIYHCSARGTLRSTFQQNTQSTTAVPWDPEEYLPAEHAIYHCSALGTLRSTFITVP